MFVCILASSAATHSRIPYLHRPSGAEGFDRPDGARGRLGVQQSALLVLMGANILGGSGLGITVALSNYFYLHLWGLKPQMIGPLASGGLLASVIGVFLAPYLSRRFARSRRCLGFLDSRYSRACCRSRGGSWDHAAKRLAPALWPAVWRRGAGGGRGA
jgi:Na+/melibiose symporter-like transporter